MVTAGTAAKLTVAVLKGLQIEYPLQRENDSRALVSIKERDCKKELPIE